MLDFKVTEALCTKCGQCVADCPMLIIEMQDGLPVIAAGNEDKCIRCQHCLAVCPTAAVSIAGFDPRASLSPVGAFPSAAQMEALIQGRRSTRQYKPEDLEPELIARLLNVVSYAPTGKNMREVRFTVIDERKKLAQFREKFMAGFGRLLRETKFSENMKFAVPLVYMWEKKRLDLVFRDAPHLLIASAPKTTVAPQPDCLIALTTFDLFAQTLGVGTLWCGLVTFAINNLLPELRAELGIPEDHIVGYAMAFGRPAVSYARTTQRAPFALHRV